MKRKHVLSITACIACLIFTFSCRDRVKTDTDTVGFDTLQVSTIYHQHDNTELPACNLQIVFVYPNEYDNADDLKNLQSLFIKKVLDASLASLSPQNALEVYTKQYFRDFNESTWEEDSENSEEDIVGMEDESGYLFYLTLSDQIIYNKNNFLSFLVEKHTYEGGAHGSKSINGYVIDLNTGKLLTEDTFSGVNYHRNLSALIAKKLADKNGISNPSELENIGYINISDIAPNNNFTLDDKGITYYFNEYEIGAYFLGVTEIFIPYEELNVYIAPDSPISSLTGF